MCRCEDEQVDEIKHGATISQHKKNARW
jgi:hypothetical protein